MTIHHLARQIDVLATSIDILTRHRDNLRTELARRNLQSKTATECSVRSSSIAEFFVGKGLVLMDARPVMWNGDSFRLARTICQYQETLVPFIRRILEQIPAAHPGFTYPLGGLPEPGRTDLLDFCRELEARKMLHYHVAEDALVVTFSKKIEHLQFFSGRWAEEAYAYLAVRTVRKLTAGKGLPQRIYLNVTLKRPESACGPDMELDIVVRVGHVHYVFEVKSGLTLDIEKWVQRARLFETGSSRYLMCAMDETLDCRTFHPFRFCTLSTFEARFQDLLAHDCGPVDRPQAVPPAPAPESW